MMTPFALTPDLFHDLWGHPAGRANEGVSDGVPHQVLPRRQPRTHSKVYNTLATMQDSRHPCSTTSKGKFLLSETPVLMIAQNMF